MGKVGRIGDRDTVYFEKDVLVFDIFGDPIVPDFHRPQLPQGCPRRVLLAKIAGRKDGFSKLGEDAFRAVSGSGDKLRIVLEQDAQVSNDAFPHVVRQRHVVGEGDLPGRLQQRHVAGGGDEVGALVVRDGVGKENACTLGDLDVPVGDDGAVLLVMAHLIGAQQNRRVIPRRFGHRRGQRRQRTEKATAGCQPEGFPRMHALSRLRGAAAW